MLLVSGVSLLAYFSEASGAPERIDQTDAIVIGAHHVSHYLVEKYFTRFVQDFNQAHGHLPTTTECAQWTQQFAAQQTIVAEAEKLGYAERPEVVDMVSRMERQMLTSPTGPFYRYLLEHAGALAEPAMRASCEQLALLRDLIVVHFDTTKDAERLLGTDIETCSAEEAMRRLSNCKGTAGVEYRDGEMPWPFYPCQEVSDAIENAAIGRWIKSSGDGSGIYYLYVRGTKPNPNLQGLHETVATGYIEFIKGQLLQRQRRQSLLRESGYSPSLETFAELTEVLRNLIDSAATIPADAVAPIAKHTLCSYRYNQGAATVTVEDYQRYFNALFVRQFPRSLSEVRSTVESLVASDLDFRAAKSLRIDLEPQFDQDRQGFKGFQELALFEKERLLPKIAVGREQVEAFYDSHKDEFRCVTSARLAIEEFDTPDVAVQWYRATKGGKSAISSTLPPKPVRESEVLLERGHHLFGVNIPTEVLLKGQEGELFGPIERGSSFLVISRGKTQATGEIPLREKESEIRSVLIQSKLDKTERELASAIATVTAVENHIDPSQLASMASFPLGAAKL